ncbi:MAG: hypothetical protein MJZ01_00785 [Bacteroidales bacterium]|nr:hypothetical protein [Bacteroidales bacterium]
MKKILTLLSSALLATCGAWAQNLVNGHEYVDLGLSVKWATMNVGANAPQEYGSYIAWGETETATKSSYDWSTYKFQADFIGDNKTSLDPEDDAAHVNWGGDWIMPSPDDFDELKQNCTCTWTKQNDVNGYKITGSNGKSIFLPAAGFRVGGGLYVVSIVGLYWSSLLDDSDAGYVLDFNGDGTFETLYTRHNRSEGMPVRPVCPSAGNTNGHVAVDLGLPSGKLWAECNIGADAPESYGSYIAWGETEDKEIYYWSTYKYMQEGKSNEIFINKYQVPDNEYGGIWYRFEKYGYDDNKTTLEKADDAATANWGDNWRIPTAAEWEELYNNTTQTWTNDYEGTGVKGYILTSTKEGHEGASLFLPAAGYRRNGNLSGVGSYGDYWSSSLNVLNSSYGRYLDFREGDFDPWDSSNRYYGQSVRPVFAVEKTPTAIESINTDNAGKTIKTVENGQIIIIRNGEKFDLAGKKL